jgi:FkbM family methyltransferase
MQVTVGQAEFVVADDEFVPFWRRVVAGDWEPASFHVLDRMLKPGSTLVDIGAWIGPLTLYGAGLADRCHAVEPDPRARDGLLANISRNPGLADRVRVHPVAIGATAGPARLGNITSVVGGDSMSSLLFGTAATSWPVECVTLEEFISGIDPPHLALVKIDIEGAEVEVLGGSRDYIERVHPPLFLSIHGRFWSDPLPRMKELVDILSSYREVMTTEFLPLDPRYLLEDEALHGLFELVAV